MKTLTLLRHAKSGWDDPVLRDFDRPLNGKGKRAAQLVGRNWRTLGLVLDHAVASPAVRVMETIEQVATGYGDALAPAWDRRDLSRLGHDLARLSSTNCRRAQIMCSWSGTIPALRIWC